MGSFKCFKKPKFGGRKPGKIDASLNEKLRNVEWGEYKIGDLFSTCNGNFDIKQEHINGRGSYVITSGLTNNGILGKTDMPAKIVAENSLTIDMFGYAFYRPFKYKLVTHARVFSLIPHIKVTDNQGIFLANAFHFLHYKFGYENMCSWKKIKDEKIQLPTKNNQIDFDFMESFVAELEAQRVAELEAYLSVTGLKDYELTCDEKYILKQYYNGNIKFKDFKYCNIFNHIKQGRRLKKNDQKPGNIPFVMSGKTNTGVVNYICNPVAVFPSNAITLDIFGNAFYRNYEFGAGDDTGVYWNSDIIYSKEMMLFLTTAMEKSVFGKFSYGKKLRSSQSYEIKMKLPVKNQQPDVETMEKLISAVQKLVIKDVVLYADNKINATKQIIDG